MTAWGDFMGGFKIFRNDVEHYHTEMVWKQNCIMCGRVSGAVICDECISKAREYYDSLLAYITENPKSTMIEVYGNTMIPFKMIKAFLELGWINLVKEDEEVRVRAADIIRASKK